MADPDSLVPVVKAAVEQHLSSTASGRAVFSRQLQQMEADQETTVAGTLEWDRDYLYFDGVIQERRVENGDQLISKSVLRIVKDASRYIISDTTTRNNRNSEVTSVQFHDVRSLDGTPYERYFISPIPLVAGTDLYHDTSPLTCLQPPDSPGVKYVNRTVSAGDTDGEIVILAEFAPGGSKELTFDLSYGGLWTRCRTRSPARGGEVLKEAKRVWGQNEAGHWYPTQSRNESRRGSWNGPLTAVTSLEISSYEPLSARAFTGQLRLDKLGPFPEGAVIIVEDATGNRVRQRIGSDRDAGFEDSLKELSKRLRTQGLGTK